MQPSDDSELLRQYAADGSNEAFAALVTRHVNVVYSVALRQVGNSHHAEEITQAVFIILARKAAQLRHHKALSSWLFQVTRLTANNFIRSESRRHRREQEAYMQTILNEPEGKVWPQIAPILDDAVARLRENDRQAILLRFYDGRDMREVGLALGTSQDAAEKRVSRALEKLRKLFVKHGVVSTTEIIAGIISANCVQAAPVALAKSVTGVAVAKGAAAASLSTLTFKGALSIMAWTKTKIAVVAGVALLFAAGAGTVVVGHVRAQNLEKLWRINKPLPPAQIDTLPSMVKVLPTKFGPPWTDLSSNPEGNKFVAARARAGQIAAFAYTFPRGRIRFATTEPTNLFDVVATLPQGSREALQRELKAKLDLVARREMEPMDVLLLRVRHANAPGLKPAIPSKDDHQYSKWGVYHSPEESIDTGAPKFDGLARFLESRFKMPVIDQTGLKERYSIDLRWREVAGHPDNEALKQDLLNRLGLELVPASMPVEMLVIDKSQ